MCLRRRLHKQSLTCVQGVVTFDGLIITANSTMNTTSAHGLNYTVTFSAASISGISSWDVPINVRCDSPHLESMRWAAAE